MKWRCKIFPIWTIPLKKFCCNRNIMFYRGSFFSFTSRKIRISFSFVIYMCLNQWPKKKAHLAHKNWPSFLVCYNISNCPISTSVVFFIRWDFYFHWFFIQNFESNICNGSKLCEFHFFSCFAGENNILCVIWKTRIHR